MELKSLSRSLIFRGVISLLFAAAAIFLPGPTLLSIALLFGTYALVDGISALMTAFNLRKHGQSWGLTFFEGLLGVVASAATLFWPGMTILVLTGVAAAWALITGIIEIVAAFRLKGSTGFARTGWIVGGVISVALGASMIAMPAIGVVTLLTLVAVYALLFGCTFIALGVKANRAARQRQVHWDDTYPRRAA